VSVVACSGREPVVVAQESIHIGSVFKGIAHLGVKIMEDIYSSTIHTTARARPAPLRYLNIAKDREVGTLVLQTAS
jgi:hypothetical protein